MSLPCTHLHILTCHTLTTSTPHGSTYSELGDGQLMEILQKHLTEWKSQEEREEGGRTAANLILFKGAIEHATRLIRVVVSTVSKIQQLEQLQYYPYSLFYHSDISSCCFLLSFHCLPFPSTSLDPMHYSLDPKAQGESPLLDWWPT